MLPIFWVWAADPERHMQMVSSICSILFATRFATYIPNHNGRSNRIEPAELLESAPIITQSFRQIAMIVVYR